MQYFSRHQNDKHDRPFKCPVETGCEFHTRGFGNVHDLKRHLESQVHGWINDSTIVFVCPFCWKMNTRADNFGVHMDSVHGGRDIEQGLSR